MRTIFRARGDPAFEHVLLLGVRSFFIAGGGITSSLSVEKMRVTSSLSSASPGTIAGSPDFAGFNASSRISSRSFALRALSSGPWHLKQLFERIGRTSRLKSGGVFAAAAGSLNVSVNRMAMVSRAEILM